MAASSQATGYGGKPTAIAQGLKKRVANVATVGTVSGPAEAAVSANENAEDVADQHFDNVLINGIMTVLVGGILLALAVVIMGDFVGMMPEDSQNGTVVQQETISEPISTSLGLAAIALVVPIVAGVVALLMGSFGGFMGGNGGNGGFGGGRR